MLRHMSREILQCNIPRLNVLSLHPEHTDFLYTATSSFDNCFSAIMTTYHNLETVQDTAEEHRLEILSQCMLLRVHR